MPNVAVYNMEGAKVGEMTLSDEVFGVEINEAALHQVVVAQQANARQGTQSALTRSEVSGGGRKPWRQKGTGRARQGSTRAPQWRHGGVVFAPKPRSYRKLVNRKVRRLAMKSALTAKAQSGELIVLDSLSLSEAKTREMAKVLKALDAKSPIIVLAEPDETIRRASSNIPSLSTTLVGTLNVLDILRSGSFIVTREAAQQIEEVYA